MRRGGKHLPIAIACLWIAATACSGDATTPSVGPEDRDGPGPVDSIYVNPSELILGMLGATTRFAAAAFAADGSNVYGLRADPGRFSWSSADPTVVTVDGGAATSVGKGTTTITVTVEDIRRSIPVTVRDRARLDWSMPTSHGSSHSGLVIGPDGTVYVGTDDASAGQSLWSAVSPEGSPHWTRPLPITWHTHPAIGADGTLYFGSRSGDPTTGTLTAVDPDGTVRWVLERLEDGIQSSPAIGPEGTIYVAAGHDLHAVRPDGEILWTFEAPDHAFVYSSPAVANDGTVYVGGADALLYAVNPDGSLRWTFETRDLIQSSPSIGTDGTIYVSSMDGFLYAVNPDGTERWSVEVDSRGVASSPSVGPDGTIYVGGAGVYAVDPGGTIRWNFPGSQVLTTPILGADGTVYVAAAGGVTALDAQGELLWNYTAGGHTGGSPALGIDGRILVASYAESATGGWEGTLHAIIETESTNGGYAGAPWPTERGDRANTGRAGG